MVAQTLAALRRNRALNLWADNWSAREIGRVLIPKATRNAVLGIVFRARQADDPRAARISDAECVVRRVAGMKVEAGGCSPAALRQSSQVNNVIHGNHRGADHVQRAGQLARQGG